MSREAFAWWREVRRDCPSPAAQVVLFTLCWINKDPAKFERVSVSAVARECGIHRVTVQRALKQLEDADLLQRDGLTFRCKMHHQLLQDASSEGCNLQQQMMQNAAETDAECSTIKERDKEGASRARALASEAPSLSEGPKIPDGFSDREKDRFKRLHDEWMKRMEADG